MDPPQGYDLAMNEIVASSAWKAADPRYERDAIDLWTRLNALPADTRPPDRAAELSSVAYVGDRLAGVVTAVIRPFDQVREKFAYYRALIDPEFRGMGVMLPMVQETWRALERWSIDNPAERLAGLAAIRTSQHLIDNYPSPLSRSAQLVHVGFTRDGFSIRIRWFEHFRISS